MPKKIVRGSGSMSLEEALNNPYRNSYSIESVTLDPAMSQEVADILTDNLSDNGFYFLGQAEVCAKEAWEWARECDTLISQRDSQIKACKALSKSRGGEAFEYWKVMSTEGVGDFAKKVWEAIKNFIKKLILMIINFIKSVGNFIKGAMAKAQELFFKKYQREILSRTGDSSGDVKIKMVGMNQNNICMVDPITLFRAYVTGTVAASGILNAAIQMIPAEMGQMVRDAEAFRQHFERRIQEATQRTLSPFAQYLKNIIESVNANLKKAFPSASSIINRVLYNNEKPSKYEYTCANVVNTYKDCLTSQTLVILASGMKAGSAANKSLSQGLKTIEQIEKKAASDYKDKSDRKSAKGTIENRLIPLVREYQRACQFNTTLLLHLYGVALSFRMKVFSAARKLVKKGDSYNGPTEKDNAYAKTALQDEIRR